MLISVFLVLSCILLSASSCKKSDDNVKNDGGDQISGDAEGNEDSLTPPNDTQTPEDNQTSEDNKTPDNQTPGDTNTPSDTQTPEDNQSPEDSQPPEDNQPPVDNQNPDDSQDSNDENPSEPTPPCEHTYSVLWTQTMTHHWNAALCEHGELKKNYERHTDEDEDGYCDTCFYYAGHTHTYEEKWSSNDTNHWKNASCSHKNERSSISLHFDNDTNGSCDICNAHVHVLSASGKCSVCGEQVRPIDTNDLTSIVYAILGSSGLINGGTVNYNYQSGLTGESARLSKLIEYTFGKDSTYLKTTSSTYMKAPDKDGNIYETTLTDVLEQWYQALSDGSTFGAARETYDGITSDLMIVSAPQNALRGYYFAASTLANAYGAEELLLELTQIANASYSKDLDTEINSAVRKVAFSFNSTLVNITNTAGGKVYNVNYFVVAVEFSYTENYALSSLSVVCDCYTNDPGANDDGVRFESDIDLDYNVATGAITLRANAAPNTYTFSVSQTVGARTYENEYPKDYFLPDSLEVYSDAEFTTKQSANIVVNQKSFVYFYLKDPKPNGKTFDCAEGELTYEVKTKNPDSPNSVEVYFSTFSSSLFFYAKYADEYVVTVSYGDDVRVFNVTVLKVEGADEELEE